MRKPLLAGNWKMNKTIAEASELAGLLLEGCSDVEDREVLVAPAFTALAAVTDVLQDSSIFLAGQNCYPHESGAFTGEVSAEFLKDAGCSAVILGHSERRQLLGESDAFISQKVHKALKAGLKIILCIGETLQEREKDLMLDVLTRQVRDGLVGIGADEMANVVIAYEPVWAIGTGKTASNEQAQEAHSFIRGLLQGLFSREVAAATRILYGG
ncbi:MAG: triose-phosphate isomerase, partial [Desulfuromonas sp.]